MAENQVKQVGHYRCPECYKKEKDIWLKFDPRDGEYYCIRCCYVAKSVVELDENFAGIRREKYKL